MSPVVLVLLIVFGFFFLCVLGLVGFGFFAARAIRNNPGAVIAKLITAGNPNMEVVDTDNGAGTLTIRDRRTGKESTITFDQARNGHFSITANDDHGGNASVQFGGAMNDLPSWVPKYPARSIQAYSRRREPITTAGAKAAASHSQLPIRRARCSTSTATKPANSA